MSERNEWPDLIIFDCDGVVIDSEILSALVLIELLKEHGTDVDLSYIKEHCTGRSFPTVADRLRDHFEFDYPGDFEATYRERLLKRFETELYAMPGVHTVLERFVEMGQPFALATSSSPDRVTRSLSLVGLEQFFAGRTFTSSQVAHGKPAPDIYHLVARTMGAVPRRCLVIEDSKVGVTAGVAAGMPVLRFLGGSHMGSDTESAGEIAQFASFDVFFDVLSDMFQPKAPYP